MIDQLARFRSNLADIADAYALLAARDRDSLRDERVKPDHDHRHREYHDDDTSAVVYGQPTGADTVADPISHAMPSGPTKERRNAPVVSGSHEPPAPVPLDLVDLTAEARRGSLDVADTSPWPEDQIGHLAVATELDFWVRDIADVCGERVPVPVVPVLAMWLHERAGWAWDYYGALDEMVVVVDRIARTLHAAVNPRGPRPEARSAPCPGCGSATLSAGAERVSCSMQDCGRVLTEAEYAEWARTVIVQETLGGPGISAAAIAIKYQRSKESVHWLAHKHGWTKSNGKQRPVLYLIADVEATMAEIVVRATRRAAQLDSDRMRKG